MTEPYTCRHCGEMILTTPTWMNENPLCENCAEETTMLCSHCGERIWRDDNAGDESTPLCQDCYDRHYTNCHNCGDLIRVIHTYYACESDGNEYPFCYDCYINRTSRKPIQDYYYKPEPMFRGDGDRYFGVELEVDGAGEDDDNAAEVMSIANGNGLENLYCKRVAAYATTKAIMRKTDDELRTLREHGLGIVYIGLESGNEELLKKFCKGVTAEEIVLNAIRCKQAGIATSVTAINGMAGANGDWQAHAIDTAKAVSRMKPDYIAFLTLRVYSGTPLHDWIASGEFKMMEPPELMRETRLFLEHIDSDGSIFRSNHASNYLPLGGTLNRDREALIHTIDEALDGKVRLRRAVELGL